MSIVSDVTKELRKLEQDDKSLRKFAISISVVLILVGALIYYKGNHPDRAFTLWGFSTGLLLLGLVLPGMLKPAHKLWMGLAFVMGWFMSRLILTILFYGVVTPIGLLMRVMGKDVLNMKIDKNAKSYWIRKDDDEFVKDRYLRLF